MSTGPFTAVGARQPWIKAALNLWRSPGLQTLLRKDRPIYGLIIFIITVSYGIAAISGYNPPPVLAAYMVQILGKSLVASSTMIFALLVLPAILSDPAAPLKAALERARQLGAMRMTTSFALLVAVLNAHGAYTLLKRLLALPYGFVWDTTLANFDRWLHFGVDPWRYLQPLANNSTLLFAIQSNYGAGWGVFIMAMLTWICVSPRADASRTRYLITYLLILFGLGTVIAFAGSSAGPIFYGAVTGDTARFADLHAFLGQVGYAPGSVLMLHDYLWQAYTSHELNIGSGISAFPSVHLATTTFAALVISEHSKRGGILAFLYLALILFSSVVLGWHYAVDGYFSIIVVTAFHYASRKIERRWARKEQGTQAVPGS